MRDGWRVLMRAPGVVLAEIVWRWTFGTALWVLLFISFHQYLSSIEISPSEYALMKALAPFTWMAITVRVMIAVVQGLRDMSSILVPALGVLWVALGSIGRAATVRALALGEARTNWPTAAALHLFRLLMFFAAVLAFFGAGVLISSASDPQLHFELNFFLMLVVLLLLSGIWSAVNWFFSVAAIFAARDGAGFWSSLAGAADLYYMGVGRAGIWFSLMRTVLAVASTFVSLIFLGTFIETRGLAPLLGMVTVTLGYFAFADALYMWRLATYISLTEPAPEPQRPIETGSVPLAPASEGQGEPGLGTGNLKPAEAPEPVVGELKADS